MALIACPECKAEVSSSAPQCPKCGYPIAGRSSPRPGAVPKPGPRGLGWLLLLILLVIVGVVLGLTNPDEPRFRTELSGKIPGFGIGAGIGEFIGTAKYNYNNYLFFSTMSVVGMDGKERTIARGFLGQVSVKPVDEWK
jgi:hypothetical protein